MIFKIFRWLFDFDHESCHKKQGKINCKGKLGISGYMPSSYEIVKCTSCRYYVDNYIEEVD